MPPSTGKREPIIVYVERDAKAKLEGLAKADKRTLSSLCAGLLEKQVDGVRRSRVRLKQVDQ